MGLGKTGKGKKGGAFWNLAGVDGVYGLFVSVFPDTGGQRTYHRTIGCQFPDIMLKWGK